MSSIASFFRRYSRAYLTFEPDRLSPFLRKPCLIIDNLGDHIITQEKDLHYLRPFLDRLRGNNIQTVDAKILADQSLTDETSFCSVRYDFRSQHQKTLGDFEAHYVLVRSPDGWRITFVKTGVVHIWNLEPV